MRHDTEIDITVSQHTSPCMAISPLLSLDSAITFYVSRKNILPQMIRHVVNIQLLFLHPIVDVIKTSFIIYDVVYDCLNLLCCLHIYSFSENSLVEKILLMVAEQHRKILLIASFCNLVRFFAFQQLSINIFLGKGMRAYWKCLGDF